MKRGEGPLLERGACFGRRFLAGGELKPHFLEGACQDFLSLDELKSPVSYTVLQWLWVEWVCVRGGWLIERVAEKEPLVSLAFKLASDLFPLPPYLGPPVLSSFHLIWIKETV